MKQTLNNLNFSLWKIIALEAHGVKVFPPDRRYRSLPFSLYRLFIGSKEMSSQTTIFAPHDKLINLKLTVCFILPKSRAIFKKFEGKSVCLSVEWAGLTHCQEFDNIVALSCREPKISRKIP